MAQIEEADTKTKRNSQLMESIWQQVPREHNPLPNLRGEYIRYVATDPKYLYLTGFVDAKRCTLEEWEAAFQDCVQPDGSYLISKEKFLSLGKYKFSGPIKNPLDALKIREGWYELDKWHTFCVQGIIPSTTLTAEHLVQAEKLMKEGGQIINGRIRIDKAAKLRIKKILDDYPSPTRRRELAVETIHQKKIQAEVARSQSTVVRTTFEKGEKVGDRQKKDLKETLLKAANINKAPNEEPVTLSLKDLKKKSKASKKQNL